MDKIEDYGVDRCIVPNTKTEYFDCCNRESVSENTEHICSIIGSVNTSLLGGLLIAFVLLLTTK